MKSIISIFLALLVVGCGKESQKDSRAPVVVYESGDLTIRVSTILSDQQMIMVKNKSEVLGIFHQKKIDGKFQTYSSSVCATGIPFVAVSDEDFNGHFERILVTDPRDFQKFTLFDVTVDDEITLAPTEEHVKAAEISDVFADFFDELFSDPDATQNFNAKVEETKEKIKNVKANKPLESTP